MVDADMEWLLRNLPKKDTLRLEASKAAAVAEIVETMDRGAMPATIGLFGTWGSGKTTTLGYVARRLSGSDRFQAIYFNAWKYAGFMETVPALIYKILTAANPDAEASSMEVLGRVMLGLGKKYAEGIGAWTKMMTGANLVEVAKDLSDIRGLVRNAAHPVAALAKQYYTQIDRSQDLLADACRQSPRVLVALIDELDRCDPGEAFEIIKQLRVFFSMRSVPIVFVLSVNPDPIGQAIKHQFGLESEWGDYEARRILEKFVDHYVEMENSNSIVEYVRGIWSAAGLDLAETCFIARADAMLTLPRYETDTVLHASFNESMLADNPVYMNRRLLAKCLRRMQARQYETAVPLTAWHLEVVEQATPALRRAMALLADDLVGIAEMAHLELLHALRRSGCFDPGGGGGLVQGSQLRSDKGGTAFAVYRSLFWERARERLTTLAEGGGDRAGRRRQALEGLLEDYRKLDFVATALMQRLGPIRFEGTGGDASVRDWDRLFPRGHLGWVVSNY